MEHDTPVASFRLGKLTKLAPQKPVPVRPAARPLAAFDISNEEAELEDERQLLAQHVAKLLEQGQDLAEEGKPTEAVRKLEAAIQLEPGAAVAHELKAQVLLSLQEAWGAVSAAQSAVQLRPEWADAHLTLARSQHALGEPALSLASYERYYALAGTAADSDVAEEMVRVRGLAAQQALAPGLRAVVQ